jgi:hypothetical protein
LAPRIDPACRLPADLLYLLERHPRAGWKGHARLGGLGRFWLERHAMFRELGGLLEGGLDAFREGRVPPHELEAWLLPRLRFFLAQLEEHHAVEDRHYFPAFRAAEPRLARGFELLDRDHEALHAAIDAVARSAQGLFRALRGPQAGREAAAVHHAAASAELVRGLARHLDDEEDLVIPLLLERGEGGLGL